MEFNTARLQKLSTKLGDFENEHGLVRNSIKILAIIENAMGIINLKEIDKYQFLKFSQERPQARLFLRCNQ